MQFIRMMGGVPLGIGLTLLFMLWSPNSPFAFAPTFFKIFGSFVAASFMMGSGVFLFGKLSLKNQARSMISELKELQKDSDGSSDRSHAQSSVGYQCSNCGATLENNADVSPHGDVKCEHCGRWFNIHS